MSATLEPVTAVRRPALYPRLWRTLPRELGFLLLAYPVALAGFVAVLVLVVTGFGTIFTFFIGVFVFIGGLYVSRAFGLVEIVRLGWAGRSVIPRPEWQDARARQGFWAWLRSIFGNGHYWLYLVHALVVNPIIALISWIVTVVWVAVALGTLSYSLWINSVQTGSDDGGKYYLTNWLVPNTLTGSQRTVAELALNALLGLLMLVLLPFVSRGLVMMHWGVARLLLGAFRSDVLQRKLIALAASQRAAASAEGQSLRKLERDLHDGPQQRLVRLQMDIAAAQRQLDADPDKARELLDGAMTQSREALEELRSLSRGFAPPLLLDRGLVPALDALTSRSAVPATFVDELPEGTELPLEIARNAYFVASELITNVAKHASASSLELSLGMRRVPDTDSPTQAETWLDLTVSDNGNGGAAEEPGHGLAGLDERVRGLGGILHLSSPVGGPTVVTVHIPVTGSMTRNVG
jgi:signal transduction histidine kinase